MYRRIKRPKEQEKFYSELTDLSEFGIFTSYKDVFMAAGVLGFLERKKKEVTTSLEGIHWNVFNLETDEAVINAVALSESGNPNLVNIDEDSFEEKITIFEEYAAGGLEILYKKVMDDPKRALNLYIELLFSLEVETTAKDRNLKDIADLLF
ncbi:DNA phosphorothioation-associated protein 4 [Bacillus sp. EB01]|uniref:DNA phosphorothioation-associated protein 4 n=1 Tax=Bacillus sp. EB01 TaxID=1347086 RepID=UPI0005C79FDE|nr:DNA phosphorothioation-associated protein 4 [Bacillus sp. EB01]